MLETRAEEHIHGGGHAEVANKAVAVLKDALDMWDMRHGAALSVVPLSAMVPDILREGRRRQETIDERSVMSPLLEAQEEWDVQMVDAPVGPKQLPLPLTAEYVQATARAAVD